MTFMDSYQNMFAALVPSIIIGAAAERGRVGPACLFMFCWTTVVYCPIAHWIWVSSFARVLLQNRWSDEGGKGRWLRREILMASFFLFVIFLPNRLLKDGRSN